MIPTGLSLFPLMVPQPLPSSFFAKVAAARTAPVDYSPAGDPDGSKAHAFVSGMYAALQKEAGLDEAAACGFLRALAELGARENNKRADLSSAAAGAIGTGTQGLLSAADWTVGKVLPKLTSGSTNLGNAAEIGNAAFQAVRHPITSLQAINIANHTPLTRTVTNDVYGGHYGDAAGHVAGGIWDAVKAHLPQSVGQFGDEAKQWLGQNVTPDNLKAIAPHVMAGLGTYAAGRMLGLGNVGSAALGLAGGYGLPKLYDAAVAGMTSTIHPGATVPAMTPVAPAAPVQTQAQANLATSSGTVDAIAAKANQPTVAPAQTPVPAPSPVTGRRVP